MFKRAAKTISKGGRVLSIFGGALALSAAFFAGPGAAQAQLDRLPELLQVTGFDNSFDYLPSEMRASMREGASRNPNLAGNGKFLPAAEVAIDKTLSPAVLKSLYVQEFADKLTPDEIGGVIDFYISPLGKRITAMETAARSPEGKSLLEAKSPELMEALSNDPDRAQALDRLETALHQIDGGVDMALNLTRMLVAGVAAGNDKVQSLPIEQIDRKLASMRPILILQAQALSRNSLSFTYHDASIEEINAYTEFLSSPLGQKFVSASQAAMTMTTSKAGYDFGHTLMRELGKEPA
jgi:hypothetical protein